jgi:outer membrane biosynthesis protein TonB
MRTVAAALDSVTESMLNVYSKRTGMEREEVRALMAAETWFSPQQAVEKGFADEMRGVVKAAAIVPVAEKRVIINGIEHDLSRFHNVPAFSATTQPNTMPKPTKPTAAGTAPAPAEEEETPTPPVTETPTPPATETATPVPPPAPSNPPKPPAPAAAAATDYDRGMQAERERVTALQAMDRPATHDIITAAIKDGKQPADIVADCMTAMDKAGTQTARRTDASSLNGIPGSEAGSEHETASFGGRIKAAVDARRKTSGHPRLSNSRN